MNKIKYIFFIVIIAFLFGCEMYPKFENEYSPAFPICGNYHVKNYAPGDLNFADALTPYSAMFIYSASFEAEKYVWINTTIGSSPNFIIKTEYNVDNLSFNCNQKPHQTSSEVSADNTKFVTIEESKIIQKEWPENDSIILKINIIDESIGLDTVFWTLGHRSTGHEEDTYDDESGE